MRSRRRSAALILAIVGTILVIGSFVLAFAARIGPFQFWVQLAVGLVLLILGLFLTVTELVESFLQRGSTALVDGLQAG